MSRKSLKVMPVKVISRQNSHIKKCKGFTLLEALIGFLILSIGMLGIASLQAISLKAGKTSVYGTVAMMKVDELFESMRANPTVLSTYTEDGADNGCTGTTNCTEVELAQDDVYWWKQNLTAGLPDNDGTSTRVVITAAAAPPSKMATVMIILNWSERNKDGEGSDQKGYATTANICTGIPC